MVSISCGEVLASKGLSAVLAEDDLAVIGAPHYAVGHLVVGTAAVLWLVGGNAMMAMIAHMEAPGVVIMGRDLIDARPLTIGSHSHLVTNFMDQSLILADLWNLFPPSFCADADDWCSGEG